MKATFASHPKFKFWSARNEVNFHTKYAGLIASANIHFIIKYQPGKQLVPYCSHQRLCENNKSNINELLNIFMFQRIKRER